MTAKCRGSVRSRERRKAPYGCSWGQVTPRALAFGGAAAFLGVDTRRRHRAEYAEPRRRSSRPRPPYRSAREIWAFHSPVATGGRELQRVAARLVPVDLLLGHRQAGPAPAASWATRERPDVAEQGDLLVRVPGVEVPLR